MTSGSPCPPIYHGHRTMYIYEITGKARQKAAWVLAVFRSRSKDIMLTLHKSMVRSQLEYCSPLYNPVKISSFQELKSVQKVFTSKISGNDRAKLLGSFTTTFSYVITKKMRTVYNSSYVEGSPFHYEQ